jgi:hypothetical protein
VTDHGRTQRLANRHTQTSGRTGWLLPSAGAVGATADVSEQYQNIARGLEWLNFQVSLTGSGVSSGGAAYSTIPASKDSTSTAELLAANSTRRLLQAQAQVLRWGPAAAQAQASAGSGRQLLLDADGLVEALQDTASSFKETVGSCPLSLTALATACCCVLGGRSCGCMAQAAASLCRRLRC